MLSVDQRRKASNGGMIKKVGPKVMPPIFSPSETIITVTMKSTYPVSWVLRL
jgi:hypothetical protein